MVGMKYGYYCEPDEPDRPVCPICHEECDKIYRALYAGIVGCNNCVDVCDAWEEDECFPSDPRERIEDYD